MKGLYVAHFWVLKYLSSRGTKQFCVMYNFLDQEQFGDSVFGIKVYTMWTSLMNLTNAPNSQ